MQIGRVTHQDAQRFIQMIKAQLDDGFGFVPFLGAGFSAPSGAPLIRDIHEYLKRCIFRSLVKPNPHDRQWEPRRDRWPMFEEQDLARQWFDQLLDYFRRQTEDSKRDPDRAVSDPLPIVQEGLGAMAEWRSALLFLSRLVRYPATERLALALPQQEVIDECLRVVIEGKHPSLEHRMLAVVAGLLRLDVLLTTNFDVMLERAFAEARNPLQVHDIALGASLPDWKAVSTRRSLVKLHGTTYGLRADFSLDQRPTEVDREHFLQYLTSSSAPSNDKEAAPRPGVRKHLLVMGYSATEQRIRDFIEHAWRAQTPLGKDESVNSFRVYWICHTSRDVEEVRAFTDHYARDQEMPESWKGSIVLLHNHVGLLLLQLYQAIRETLPPSGCIFPSISRLSVPPFPKAQADERRSVRELDASGAGNGEILHGKLIKAVVGRVKSFFPADAGVSRILALWSREGVFGATSIGGDIFRELQMEYSCLWVDMNDINKVDGLFEALLEAAYVRVGVEHWTPVYMATDPRRRVEQLARVARMSRKNWVIFINARETPGANADGHRSAGHGWLDEKDDAKQFADLMNEVCGTNLHPANRILSVVLLCRERQSELVNTLMAGPLEQAGLFELVEGARPVSERVETAVRAAGDHLPFLHTLALMQRPRFMSFVPWYAQNRGVKAEDLWKFLEKLEEDGVVRWKPGGFLWFHSQTRQELREKLNTQRDETPGIHRELSIWYRRVLDASSSPSAVFEVVHHLCQAALAEPDPERRKRDIIEATAVLSNYSWMIQTHGYSKGSCRRLESARHAVDRIKDLDADCGVRFKIRCTEIMRAIAREVGEDSTAYGRTRELRRLLAGRSERPPSGGAARKGAERQELEASLRRREVDGALDWIRWWRWSGMLGMASRSLDLGMSSLSRAVYALGGDFSGGARGPAVTDQAPPGPAARSPLGQQASSATDKPVPAINRLPTTIDLAPAQEGSERPVAKVIEDLLSEAWCAWGEPVTSPRERQRFRIEALRVLEQFAELQLVRLSVKGRLAAIGSAGSPGDIPDSLSSAFRVSRELVGRVLAEDFSDGSRDSVQARWCMSRMLMHESAAAGHLGEHAGESAAKAMRLLSEAEGCYKLAEPLRFHSDLAIIELHRADAKLREASGVQIAGGMPFGKWCGQREADRNTPVSVPELEARQIRAILSDSMRFLDRAEPVLRERRRNVWWTGWFFERKLRAISMLMSVAELEGFTGMIPFVGLAAAPADSQTEPDILLHNTMRMTRVDAFRLATVLDSYAACALGLMRYRGKRYSGTQRLAERQRLMRDSLRAGLEQIEAVLDRRPGSSSEISEPLYPDEAMDEKCFRMDQDVSEYVAAVAKRSKSAIALL